MAGVYYGYDAIPDRWKEKILVKDQLTSISKQIFKG
jgi:ADP-ribosyl-[dinitrogen reductase] hydrolase